jgi:TatD DNase family protein
MPYRGKTNNPSYVPLVARQIAEIKQQPLDEIARVTSRNFEQLFNPATA